MLRQKKMNALLSVAELSEYAHPASNADTLLRSAMSKWHWSARAYHRVLKLARTIADMDGALDVGQSHVAEAIQYRRALSAA